MKSYSELAGRIVKWISDYAKENEISTLVIGVSGGIDSAVTSTLCAETGLRTIALSMPIHQLKSQNDLSLLHCNWLKSNWNNVETDIIDLSETFNSISLAVGPKGDSEMALANTRARLRMATLYAFAASNEGIVVGTGNKVEDFGVGFYTKYGDGGVDISPIADLYKSEVFSLASSLGVIQEIQEAPPTDGLWADGRTDEEQIGATYEELEWAMREIENPSKEEPSERQRQVMVRYMELNKANSHKMKPIPVFKRTDR
ncbi:MAG TPA: NAD(+) synthase [Candidatus Poseidoniales archaeon]|nr:NAD(+) synthase [Euryarchaeota archaeon]DAC30938.1 MAG TPA: NAD(+) synthase [Candidatus Poseidoniales archaeon]|tara:strand:- start:229 stop:1002 length:774 start_codon:yes stop_codon:yes gene_type:complete